MTSEPTRSAEAALRRARLVASVARAPIEIRARGQSMRPFLKPGDRVRLEQRPPRRGDIVLVALEDRMVLHRFVRQRGGICLVRSDAAASQDVQVHPDQVLAVATARRRPGPGPARWVRLDRPVWRAGGLATGRARKVSRIWLAHGPVPSQP